MREHEVISADGTKIRAWRTDADGPTVLLCPGVGSGPQSWPSLLDNADVISWYMRGTMGSDRPSDESHITVRDHVADAIAALDDAGVDRCVVMGWSMGVTIAVELARRHPDRVSGLLLVAGAPGDSFGGMLPMLPAPLRRAAGVASTRLLQAAGPLLDSVLHRMPVNDVTAFLLRHSGMIKRTSDPETVKAAIAPFLQHDWRWYFTLALALGTTPRQNLANLRVPITVLAGKDDMLASTESTAGTVGALAQARVRLLPCSHYLPLEAPDVVVSELHLLQQRVDAVEWAVADMFTHASRTDT